MNKDERRILRDKTLKETKEWQKQKDIKTRLVQITEDGENVLLANTTMTDKEIETAINDESLDEKNMDYEEKLTTHAENLNKVFERIYADEVIL